MKKYIILMIAIILLAVGISYGNNEYETIVRETGKLHDLKYINEIDHGAEYEKGEIYIVKYHYIFYNRIGRTIKLK